ncbi:hypothetical protein P152DRAFT_94702 [Eremomyces bilateralis CBS 781.70]|uniref:Transcription factor domain-containing protein n=1 Tax=Eremomyces bilateralis CBS 781.70 TaxID=1392243 RepID=A0A6G1FWZ8_9PEZI|nr:uncharacterized protein P152DRAFT_94702 [Eremomyces bilateralis CBS 781.70]KAF1810313.1 hypothetical protein P152DRAFT_94702 [Eremomyces bilateralis CBS 781.70]
MTEAITAFSECTGTLYYAFTQEQVDDLLHSAFGQMTQPETAFLDVFKENADLQDRARIAELCGMAAVGIYYERRSDQDSGPPAALAEYFYVISKLMLDSSIAAHPLRAMKVCSLLAMYNIVVKASVALEYVELGLALGNRHGMDKPECPPTLSAEEFLDYKRTWRTLVLFSGWLGATLGYISAHANGALKLWEGEKDIGEDGIVQLEMVKITIIKAKIVQTMPDESTANNANDATIDWLRQELRTLYDGLPERMAIRNLQEQRHDQRLRRAIFYVHLFYLSAMELLHRRAMASSLAFDQSVDLSFIAPSSYVNAAVREGLMAAKMATRILALMKEDDAMVQICWLCIYTAYTAGIIILYTAVRKVLNGFPSASWSADMTLATTCINTLDYCGEVDDVATRFRETLQTYLSTLQNAVDGEVNENLGRDIEEESSVEYLFGIKHGSSDLQKASRDLLSLLQRPFRKSLELMPQGVAGPQLNSTLINWMEAALGASGEWVWELQNCGIEVGYGMGNDNHLEEIISALDSGYFVGTATDAGWKMWTPHMA